MMRRWLRAALLFREAMHGICAIAFVSTLLYHPAPCSWPVIAWRGCARSFVLSISVGLYFALYLLSFAGKNTMPAITASPLLVLRSISRRYIGFPLPKS